MRYYRLSDEPREYRDVVESIFDTVISKYQVFKKRLAIGIAIVLLSPIIASIYSIPWIHRLVFFLAIVLAGVYVILTGFYLDARIVRARRVYYPIIGMPVPIETGHAIVLYGIMGGDNVVKLSTIEQNYLQTALDIERSISSYSSMLNNTLVTQTPLSSLARQLEEDPSTGTRLTALANNVFNTIATLTNRLGQPVFIGESFSLLEPRIRSISLDRLFEIKDPEKLVGTIGFSTDDLYSAVNRFNSVFDRLKNLSSLLNTISNNILRMRDILAEYNTWIKNTALKIASIFKHVTPLFSAYVCPRCLIKTSDYGPHAYPWVKLESLLDSIYLGECVVCKRKYSDEGAIRVPRIMRVFMRIWDRAYRSIVSPLVDTVINDSITRRNVILNNMVATVNTLCTSEERALYRSYGGVLRREEFRVLRECLEHINNSYTRNFTNMDELKAQLKFLGEWVIHDKLEACRRLKDTECCFYSIFANAVKESRIDIVKKIIDGKADEVLAKAVKQNSSSASKEIEKDPCENLKNMRIPHDLRERLLLRIDRLRNHITSIVDNARSISSDISKDAENELDIVFKEFSLFNEWARMAHELGFRETLDSAIEEIQREGVGAIDLDQKIQDLAGTLRKISSIRQSIKNVASKNVDLLRSFMINLSVPANEPIVFYIPVYIIDIVTRIQAGRIGELKRVMKIYDMINNERLLKNDEPIISYVLELIETSGRFCVDTDVIRGIREASSRLTFFQRVFLNTVLLRGYNKIICRD